MISKKKRQMKALCAGLLVLGAIQSPVAWADCQLASSIPRTRIVQVRDVMVDGSLPAGTPLGREGTHTLPTGSWAFNCSLRTTPTPVTITTSIGPSFTFVNGVYQFTVNGQPSGVGLEIFVSEDGGPKKQFPYQESLTIPNANPWTRSTTYYTSLVRVGGAPVVYGAVDNQGQTIVQNNLRNSSGMPTNAQPYRFLVLGDFVLVRPSCSIDTASLNQTVRLGDDHNVSAFANSTPSAWVPFNLTIANCDDPTVLANITFGTGADADANNNTLFSMNQGGPEGLGIAIATAGMSSTAMLPGQTQTFPNPGSGNSFAFQARLQPTIGQVTPGVINRPVTVLVNFK
jgi:hypothetical protein